MEYKVFLKKILLFAVLLIALDRFFGFAMIKINSYSAEKNPEHYWIKSSYVIERCDAPSLIIGSSDAMVGIDPIALGNTISLETYNCGMDGCHFLYQNCVLNTVLDRYTPKLVVWGVDPLDFIDSVDTGEYYRAKNLSPYYKIGYKWVDEYMDGEGEKAKIQRLSKLFSYNSRMLNLVAPAITRGPQNRAGYSPQPVNSNVHIGLIKEDETIKDKGNSSKLRKIEATLNRCSNCRINLTLVVLPKLSIKSASYLNSIERLVSIAGKYNYRLIDCSSLDEFMLHNELFKDNEHLNEDGANRFTEVIIDSLKYSI